MEKNNKTDRLQETAIIVLTLLSSGVAAFLYGRTEEEILRIIIVAFAMAGTVVFVMEESRLQQSFLFDNGENLWRFTLLYLIFLAGSVVFPMLPFGGWPYLAIFTGLMLFSNRIIALCAGSTMLMISFLLSSDISTEVFVIYFISGVIGIFLFSGLDEAFRVGIPLMVSLLWQFLLLSLYEIFSVNAAFRAEMLFIPGVNTLVSLILLLILLKLFSFSIIYRTRDTYMDINDPECPLLVELKEFSREEYYHAIHTAYLCERIARRLGMDDAAAKAGGYYHKIGILKGENTFENTRQVLVSYSFPDKVLEILKEYLDREEQIVSKETAVLLFSDTMISSIRYLFSKDAGAVLDYEKLIQAVFKKKLESGILNRCQISVGELEEMKKILMEEKLYYDFLR
jgi:hypothetical protein